MTKFTPPDGVRAHVRCERLADLERAEEVRRYVVELHGTRIVWQGAGHVGTIDRDVLEFRRRTADLDVFAFALVPFCSHAGHAGQRFGDVVVGQRADLVTGLYGEDVVGGFLRLQGAGRRLVESRRRDLHRGQSGRDRSHFEVVRCGLSRGNAHRGAVFAEPQEVHRDDVLARWDLGDEVQTVLAGIHAASRWSVHRNCCSNAPARGVRDST